MSGWIWVVAAVLFIAVDLYFRWPELQARREDAKWFKEEFRKNPLKPLEDDNGKE